MAFDSGSMRVVQRAKKRLKVKSPSAPVALEPTKPTVSDLEEIISSMTVREVIDLVESNMAELDDVIAAERTGKRRKTILALVRGESGSVYPQYSE